MASTSMLNYARRVRLDGALATQAVANAAAAASAPQTTTAMQKLDLSGTKAAAGASAATNPAADIAGHAPNTQAVLDAAAQGKQDAKDSLASQAPADTYGATLRELARARTQMMIRATNGRSGSIQGIGAGGTPFGRGTYEAASPSAYLGKTGSGMMPGFARPLGYNTSDTTNVGTPLIPRLGGRLRLL